MDPFRRRLDEHSGALPAAGRRVADYLDLHRAAVLASSAKQLAERAGTSDATVIRTIQRLGYAGLNDLKRDLLAAAERPPSIAEPMRRTLVDVGANAARAVELVFEAHQESLRGLREPGAVLQMAAAVSALHPAERIAVFGIGPSAALARYVQIQLARTGRRTLALDTTGAMLGDQMLELRAGDAVLVLAYGRAYREVVTVFGEARRLGLPIVLVTDGLDRALADFAKVVVPASRGRADRVALHGATLVCLEAIVLGLAAADRDGSVATLERLDRLRKSVRG